jgi:ubiquinone/menaquinone biosynthesis C-methylase UbiE
MLVIWNVASPHIQLPPEAYALLAEGVTRTDDPDYLHLRSRLTVLTYLRLSQEISGCLPPGAKVLDWGAGAGQMTYLLSRKGLQVTPYYYREGQSGFASQVLTFNGERFEAFSSGDPVRLPFADGAFQAVLSCGVLEHVADDRASLRELARVLQAGGQLFVYQLPQYGSWLEFFIRRFKLGYYHERRYREPEIRQRLAEAGFEVTALRRANMLPKNFTGLQAGLKKIFEAQAGAVLKIDSLLSRVPLLNYLGGIFEIRARKT